MADADILKGFVVESYDLLDDVEPKLIELQQGSAETGQLDPETINAVFRLFHSMKGSAGCLQLTSIASLTHEAETLLDLFRRGKATMKEGHVSLLFKSIDLTRSMLGQVDATLSDQGFEDRVETLAGELKAAIAAETSSSSETEAETDVPAAERKPADSATSGDDLSASDAEPGSDAKADESEPPLEIAIEINDEMRSRFVDESEELLEKFEQALLDLEKSGETVHAEEAFRCVHSFKGNCGFMGLADLEGLSHKMETMLETMKAGAADPGADFTNVLLSLVDVLRDSMGAFAEGGEGHIDKIAFYLDYLNDLLPPEREVSSFASNVSAPTDRASGNPAEDRIAEAGGSPEAKGAEPPAESAESGEPDSKDIDEPDAGKAEPGATSAKRPKPEEAKPAAPPTAEKHPPRALVRQDIRVDLEKLDRLINLVGELVISEAMMTRHPAIAELEEEGVERAIYQLRRVSRDLQDIAMSVRMVPLAATFKKMIRVVHDLSNKSGKKVQLELRGEDTEVDKTVIEQVADPLVHIVRNAIDHGIETPEARAEAGKPEQGTLVIEGLHEGGEVWIVIRDDGRGIDRDKVLQKAIDRGLVEGDGSELSDGQVYKLIFEPGFSTAEKVTDVSGRGVGMDVVKKNIEKLRGKVDVRCVPGEGSTFVMRIPLTLAIVEGMLVRVGQARYTIPILTIRETFNVTPEQVTITADGREVVRIREELLPVVRLHETFGCTPDHTELSDGILIIVESEGQTFCLFVDEIVGQQETVIKGLSDYLGHAHGISGCTILGDGEVSLILDMATLVSMMGGSTSIQAA
jgi:two-component system chemotaxis sensor kinase CheA